MQETILKLVVPAVMGLLGGVVGSLIAPWVHWGIEKRRSRQAKRRELIDSCRMLLTTDIDRKTFRETEVYAKLRPHLYQLVIEAVEKDQPPGESEEDKNAFKQKLLEDLARIEREWVLI
ncbi:MAG: hypothetical protein JRH18_04445 [Deltaproteobacteria bacterium]|nr:hypothetical protein [Deltaproteobacteria bacterium]MBW1960593.1 hypothetical protein [Deltaproteobacteria bacterium]MBW2150896.1 hypothetical protein [Deltaproteobacteria bacterium]